MSSFELLELFGVSIDDSVTLDGKTFDADTPIVTSAGWSTAAVLEAADKTRTIRVDFAPEDGALADALRDGERPEWKRMLAQTANETAVLRAGQVKGADDYGSQIFPMWREPGVDGDQASDYDRAGYDDDTTGGLSALWQEKEVG